MAYPLNFMLTTSLILVGDLFPTLYLNPWFELVSQTLFNLNGFVNVMVYFLQSRHARQAVEQAIPDKWADFSYRVDVGGGVQIYDVLCIQSDAQSITEEQIRSLEYHRTLHRAFEATRSFGQGARTQPLQVEAIA